MKRGQILQVARHEGSELFQGTVILLAICGAILGYNWKYVYNWFAGPFRFDSALSTAPGAREWVLAEGRLVPTGVVQETTLRLLRGLAETKRVSARYLAMLVDGKLLVVKVAPEFSGQVVEGRLTPMPESIRSSFPAGSATHPWLIDADTAYRWDFNLFVMIAGPLFAVFLPLTLYSAWRGLSVERHPAIAGLRRFGSPLQVVPKIENEMSMAGDKARAGPLWLTPSWVVMLEPSLYIYPLADLVAVGREVEVKKSGEQQHSLRFWRRGRSLSDDVNVTAKEAQAAAEGLTARLPGVLVDDAKAFERRWRQDRAACEAEADARRGVGPRKVTK